MPFEDNKFVWNVLNQRYEKFSFDDDPPGCAVCKGYCYWYDIIGAWECIICFRTYQPSLGHYYRER